MLVMNLLIYKHIFHILIYKHILIILIMIESLVVNMSIIIYIVIQIRIELFDYSEFVREYYRVGFISNDCSFYE